MVAKTNMYEEACFSQKNVHKLAKSFKDGQNSIQNEGKLTMTNTLEMVDSVKTLILTDRRVTT